MAIFWRAHSMTFWRFSAEEEANPLLAFAPVRFGARTTQDRLAPKGAGIRLLGRREQPKQRVVWLSCPSAG
jgi:hypothetical protein